MMPLRPVCVKRRCALRARQLKRECFLFVQACTSTALQPNATELVCQGNIKHKNCSHVYICANSKNKAQAKHVCIFCYDYV